MVGPPSQPRSQRMLGPYGPVPLPSVGALCDLAAGDSKPSGRHGLRSGEDCSPATKVGAPQHLRIQIAPWGRRPRALGNARPLAALGGTKAGKARSRPRPEHHHVRLRARAPSRKTRKRAPVSKPGAGGSGASPSCSHGRRRSCSRAQSCADRWKARPGGPRACCGAAPHSAVMESLLSQPRFVLLSQRRPCCRCHPAVHGETLLLRPAGSRTQSTSKERHRFGC